MKFHFNGKYSGDPKSLPTREHEEGSTLLKKPATVFLSFIALVITLAAVLPVYFISKAYMMADAGRANFYIELAAILVGIIIVAYPHEYLQARCYKGDVYMYSNPSRGSCFVVGPELIGKGRYIFMCLFPNLLFGLMPYVLWLLMPRLWYLGIWGGLILGRGGEDYVDMINALIKMPKGAKLYHHGLEHFWVITDRKD